MKQDMAQWAGDSGFLEQVRQSFNTADADLVGRAHALARSRLQDQGVGLQAACLLLEQQADAISIACALLAPLLWQGLIETADIAKRFGVDVADTLEDLLPSVIHHGGSGPHPTREDIQSLLTVIRGTPRRALLLIVFRLLILEQAASPFSDSLQCLARETLDLLLPIANRLGLGALQRRLEDACFRIVDTFHYERLEQCVAPIRAEDDKCLHLLMVGVQRLLANNHIPCRVQGRTKSLYSIHRKIQRTGKSLDAIMDRLGVRVIVSSVPECYAVLGLLHAHFKPIPGTFDDYIGLPKNNGYQSLHTCVYPIREITHKPIEFQVRTELMHLEAEHGTAAHWRYKNEQGMIRDEQQTQWMHSLVVQHREAPSSEAFIRRLHHQVFKDHLVVFGNGGRIVRLEERATVRDYLKMINARLPRNGVVKVNGRVVTLDCPLRDGDSIEVPTDGDARDARRQTIQTEQPRVALAGSLPVFSLEESSGKEE